MRVLLDESLPRKLGSELTGHAVLSVQACGWSGLKNGELLRRASVQFDVLVTGDQNLEYQQDQTSLPIAIVVLVAVNNRIETLRPLIPDLLDALNTIRSGQIVRVGA